jgi:ATP-dependent DNA ligase
MRQAAANRNRSPQRSACRFHTNAVRRSENPHASVFDVLEVGGTEQLARPYGERRAVLEDLFARVVLGAPFTLCPATTDRATAQDWLGPAWGSAGIQGVVVKGLAQSYLPGKRAWIKVRPHHVRSGDRRSHRFPEDSAHHPPAGPPRRCR